MTSLPTHELNIAETGLADINASLQEPIEYRLTIGASSKDRPVDMTWVVPPTGYSRSSPSNLPIFGLTKWIAPHAKQRMLS
jgi:hypothetical protein